MKVFIIPSWYPTEAFPSAGIFFKEQAKLISKYRPNWNIGMSIWGSHEPNLWIKASRPLEALIKISSKPYSRNVEKLISPNFVELFSPAHTWSRKIKNGNIDGIIRSNKHNLQRFIDEFGKPDILHAHASYPGGYIAMNLSKSFSIPYVITEHMSPFPMPSFSSDYKKFLLPPLENANLVLSVSKGLKERLEYFGIKSKEVSNFIDDQIFNIKPSKPPTFTFLNVGRLEKQKNHMLLIKAAKILVEKGLSIKIKVIGSGSLSRKLKKRANSLGLNECFDWMGERNQIEIIHQLQNSEAFILTSAHENQPVAILEALACGLPVVTTPSGVEDMISSAVGFVANAMTPDEVSKCMEIAIDKNISHKTVRDYFNKTFGTEKCIDSLERHYDETLKNF